MTAGAQTDDLIRAVYPELRDMASRLLRGERDGHTLQRTALVHETLLRMFGYPEASKSPRDFLAFAARKMRHVLIDYGRRHRSLKAGHGFARVELDKSEPRTERDEDSLLALNEALDRLGALDARALSVVELKFFGGFTTAETAEILELSGTIVEENWHFARSWLFGALTDKSRRFV
jgi:RNA polymerase sigma factor (TIGR02999 family)